jgi:putative transposase
MRDLAVLFLHLLATVVRLAGPGGSRAVVAESVLVKQQLLILNRSRKRSPNLRLADRMVAGVCALLVRPGRLIRSAIVLKPSTLLRLHRTLTKRKYRLLFSPTVRKKPGSKGPNQELMAAVVDMKRRNPTWGCPRIAQQIALAFGIPINKDVVRRILGARYQPQPDSTLMELAEHGINGAGRTRSVCDGQTNLAHRVSVSPAWSRTSTFLSLDGIMANHNIVLAIDECQPAT